MNYKFELNVNLSIKANILSLRIAELPRLKGNFQEKELSSLELIKD